MQNFTSFITQLSASQAAVQTATQPDWQNSASGASGGNSSASFQQHLDNAAASPNSANSANNSNSSNSSNSSNTGQVLPAASGSQSGAANSAQQSSASVSKVSNGLNTGNLGKISALLGNLLQHQSTVSSSQAQTNNANTANIDNLLLGQNNADSSQQNNITTPTALLSLMANQNNQSALAGLNTLADMVSGAATAEGVDIKKQNAAATDQNSAAIILLAAASQLTNIAANQASTPAANSSAQPNDIAIDANAAANSGNTANQLLQLQTALAAQTTAAENAVAATPANTVAMPVQADYKKTLDNLAGNLQVNSSASGNTKLISENKLPDFSDFSKQVYVVKPQSQAANAQTTGADDNDIQNAIANLQKSADSVNDVGNKRNDDGSSDFDVSAIAAQSVLAKNDTQPAAATANTNLQNVAKYQPTPAEQVSVQIAALPKDGNSTISIQLEPAKLGKVDVTMNVGKDGQLNVNISAAKSDTLAFLKQDAATLTKTFSDLGFKSDTTNLSFNLRQEGGNAQQQAFANQNYYGNSSNNEPVVSPAYTITPTMFSSNQALDIRV